MLKQISSIMYYGFVPCSPHGIGVKGNEPLAWLVDKNVSLRLKMAF
jgi:hypothetical protein